MPFISQDYCQWLIQTIVFSVKFKGFPNGVDWWGGAIWAKLPTRKLEDQHFWVKTVGGHGADKPMILLRIIGYRHQFWIRNNQKILNCSKNIFSKWWLGIIFNAACRHLQLLCKFDNRVFQVQMCLQVLYRVELCGVSLPRFAIYNISKRSRTNILG